MEEIRNNSNPDPTATAHKNTNKLAPENGANTIQPDQSAISNGQSIRQCYYSTTTSGRGFTTRGNRGISGRARRGTYRPRRYGRIGCQPGDIIMITGARTTAAKVVPSAMVDRGQQTIQMDSQVRQNSASGLGERITVHKAKVRNAEKITLLPLSGGAPIQESDLQYIARYLIGLPVTIGDLLRVGTPGAAPREFLIIGTTPATPSYTIQKRTTANSIPSFLPCSHNL